MVNYITSNATRWEAVNSHGTCYLVDVFSKPFLKCFEINQQIVDIQIWELIWHDERIINYQFDMQDVLNGVQVV
jgi:hypothetical protein